MVRSINPRRVKLRQIQWPLKVEKLLGTRVAETILVSGHVRPHPKAAHMEASDPIKNICRKTLASGSRPHMDLVRSRAASCN
jgi:hypothetical protein